MLPNISSVDLGHPDRPGEYPYQGGSVQVDAFHVAAWRTKPGAAFNSILRTRIGCEVLNLVLGQKVAAPAAA